jgi:A/G-specific adenine glycosylase
MMKNYSFSLSPSAFQKKLLHWFDKHGRKDLPWQKNKTPYRVWISEIMLQQTQVNTVITYYERFMEKFSGVEQLAKSDEDTVLLFWAGLGYYHRARHLHSAAKKIFFEWQNQFPETLEDLQTLPGIGRSTAAAILSLAFETPATILDGNVKRVLSRLHAVQEWPQEKILWALAEKYSAEHRPADYTQAMMDLGATICTRGKPRCGECPFEKNCLAHLQGIEKDLPLKKPRKKLPIRAKTFFIFRYQEQILLEKRPTRGIWSGLFSFPEENTQLSSNEIKKVCRERFQQKTFTIQCQESFRHTFTHFHLDILPVVIDIKAPLVKEGYFWYKLQQSNHIGVPAPVKLLLNQLEVPV